MAAWSALTPEQRENYQSWEKDLRALNGSLQKLCNAFVALDARYVAQIQAILVVLDNNTIVPNSSGLAGSSSLDSDAEAATLQSHIQGILTNYNTPAHQQMRAKAAGASNV